MTTFQSSSKAKWAIAMVIAFALITLAFILTSISQNWLSLPLSALPFGFWAFYATVIVLYGCLFFLRRILYFEPYRANTGQRIFTSAICLLFGFAQVMAFILAREPKAMTLLLGSFGVVLVLFYGSAIVRELRTPKHFMSNKR